MNLQVGEDLAKISTMTALAFKSMDADGFGQTRLQFSAHPVLTSVKGSPTYQWGVALYRMQ